MADEDAEDCDDGQPLVRSSYCSAAGTRRASDDNEEPPELSCRALILSSFLAVILGAANVYLGLFAGLTVSASIPAAIISMAVLRSCFSGSSVLENNLVQTAASAGEALAAGVIFTFPALIILHNEYDEYSLGWSSVHYMTTVVVSMCGGILGIVFSIPIRRALLHEIQPPLAFPEGVACANVLQAGESGSDSAVLVVKAALVGGTLKLLQATRIAIETLSFGFMANGSPLLFRCNASAALFGVGYIVGWKVCIVFLVGSVCNWLVAIPIGFAAGYLEANEDAHDAESAAFYAYSTKTKFLGVGAMLVGGMYALVNLRAPLVAGVRAGIKAFRESSDPSGSFYNISRVDRDIPLPYCMALVVCCIVPFYLVIASYTGAWAYSVVLSIFVLLFGFFTSAIAAYMAGLVGSSNNPLSGVTICVVLATAFLMLIYFNNDPVGPAATIFVAAMIACAGSISGDNMQDLKTGQIVGATPWKQQIMLILGVVVSSLVMPAVLQLLNSAYGFGSDVNGERGSSLPAPQASLMATVAIGVIRGGLPWGWIGIGTIAGIVVIAIDLFLKSRKSQFSMPVLAFAVGFYLPMETGVSMIIGSLVELASDSNSKDEASEGVLYSGGLITGEALMGILTAIPIVLSGNSEAIFILEEGFWWLSAILCVIIIYSLYKISISSTSRANRNDYVINRGALADTNEENVDDSSL